MMQHINLSIMKYLYGGNSFILEDEGADQERRLSFEHTTNIKMRYLENNRSVLGCFDKYSFSNNQSLYISTETPNKIFIQDSTHTSIQPYQDLFFQDCLILFGSSCFLRIIFNIYMNKHR
ncbi:MAG: hypothetical protein FJ161_04235 [Gammaproteobacteria bacterium]|nr:hypothetical protein [Gammaproteobacteria bacterium]